MAHTATIAAPGSATTRVRVQVNGARRLIRRLDGQRRTWLTRPVGVDLAPTEQAWRAGIAEGLRLAQITLRQGV